jgi:hypothetical protein
LRASAVARERAVLGPPRTLCVRPSQREGEAEHFLRKRGDVPGDPVNLRRHAGAGFTAASFILPFDVRGRSPTSPGTFDSTKFPKNSPIHPLLYHNSHSPPSAAWPKLPASARVVGRSPDRPTFCRPQVSGGRAVAWARRETGPQPGDSPPHSNGGHEFGPEIRTKRTTHRTESVTGAPDPVRCAPDSVKLRHAIPPNSNRGARAGSVSDRRDGEPTGRLPRTGIRRCGPPPGLPRSEPRRAAAQERQIVASDRGQPGGEQLPCRSW